MVQTYMYSPLDHYHYHYAVVMQFKVDGRWHTWIDFDKFIELVSPLGECTLSY